jgi:hypothetical protein
MHVQVVVDAELPLANLIPLVPSAPVNTSLSDQPVAFLCSLSMWPPLRLSLLCSLSASISLAVFGEPRPPRNGRTQTSCSSCVFFVLEGLCQLVVLSVWLECPS